MDDERLDAGEMATERGSGNFEELASAEEWLEHRVAVEPGGTLFVDLDRGSVEVDSHDQDEVVVEASARGWSAGLVRFTLERNGNDVVIDGSIDHWMPALFGRPKIQVRCLVPRRYSVEVETRGGRVEIDEISGRVYATTRGSRVQLNRIDGPALVRTSGGSVKVRELTGDLRVKTSGGSIKLERIDGNVEARTSGGSIDADDVGGQLDAHTSGASVRARFRHEPWGRLETSGGSIKIECDRDSAFDLDAATSGGTVKLSLELDPGAEVSSTRARGPVNGGGSPLVLRTSGGSIKISHR